MAGTVTPGISDTHHLTLRALEILDYASSKNGERFIADLYELAEVSRNLDTATKTAGPIFVAAAGGIVEYGSGENIYFAESAHAMVTDLVGFILHDVGAVLADENQFHRTPFITTCAVSWPGDAEFESQIAKKLDLAVSAFRSSPNLPDCAALTRLRAQCKREYTLAAVNGNSPAATAETEHQGARPASPRPELAPVKLLANWREILIALGMKFSTEDKQKVLRLNKTYSGPIVIPGQGKQPLVDKAQLLEWYNGLAAKFNAEQERKRDAQATVSVGHEYGRDGEVTPDLAGGVKKRRRNQRS